MKPSSDRIGLISALILLIPVLSLPSWANDSTIIVEKQNYPNWYALEARMEAVNEATISAQTSGRIQSIAFDVNDYVEKDSIIIQLKNTQQKAAMEQAQAGLKQAMAANQDAQSQLNRSTPLFQQGSVSQRQYDSIKAAAKSAAARVEAAQAQLAQAKEQLSYTQIRAPYSGIVKDRLVEVGESVNPGTPLMTGLSLAKLRAVADIPQRFSPHMSDQSQFKVVYQHQGSQTQLDAERVTLFPYADPNSHSFRVRVEVNAEGSHLFPGMWVKLHIPMGEIEALRVPKSSIVQKGDLSAVYIKTDNGFRLRQVRLGNEHGENIDVLSGIRSGEEIAADPYSVMAKKEV